MSSIHFNDLKVYIAEQLKESISRDDPVNVYLFFGKTLSWANDADPAQANTMPLTFHEIWDNAIGAKKITGFDLNHVIPYNEWTANTVYHQYDQRDENLYTSNSDFYVVTSDFNVYKCIFNNYDTPSTQEPSNINPETITQTIDGYIWKYMFTVRGVDQLKATKHYIPVRTLTDDDSSLQWQVQENAVEGAIYAVKIEDGGTGYSNVANLSAVISGDGTGATITLGVNTASNTINTATITQYGSGYHHAEVTVSGGGGSGAVIRPLLSPPGGHGSNPLYELGGSRMLIESKLNNTEGDILPINNDIRQISLIKEPYLYGTSNVASNTVISQTLDVTVTGGGVDYENDELVFQGPTLQGATFTARVFDYDSATSTIKLINTNGNVRNETLFGANSTASKFITSVKSPGFQKYTGQLLYVDNIVPIYRNQSQIEDFKIIISLD